MEAVSAAPHSSVGYESPPQKAWHSLLLGVTQTCLVGEWTCRPLSRLLSAWDRWAGQRGCESTGVPLCLSLHFPSRELAGSSGLLCALFLLLKPSSPLQASPGPLTPVVTSSPAHKTVIVIKVRISTWGHSRRTSPRADVSTVSYQSAQCLPNSAALWG